MTKSVTVSEEDRQILIWGYKCTLVGIIIDWLDNGASYDLSASCEKILNFYTDSGKKLL